MATINATITDVSTTYDKGAITVTWATMTESDSAAAFDMQEYEAAAVEFTGTFGGATIVLQGAVLSTYQTLKDAPGGSDISKTSAGWQTVGQQPRLVKPSASGGTSQSLTTTLLLRRKTAFGRS